MSKRKARFDDGDRPGLGGSRAGREGTGRTSLLCFSFKYFDPDHPTCHCRDRDDGYFRKLLERIKALSGLAVAELTAGRGGKALRFHPVDFAEDRVSQAGFGIPGGNEFDDDAWQFSVSANEHGRVCGFLLGDVFYIVWLDAGHQIYPGRGR